jgi:hypothetical protein
VDVNGPAQAGPFLLQGPNPGGCTCLPAAGKGKLVLKFSTKARKKLARKRSVKLNVRFAVVDAAGNPSTARGTLTIKR